LAGGFWDLHHVGPCVREEHRAIAAGDIARKVHDPKPVEWASIIRSRRFGFRVVLVGVSGHLQRMKSNGLSVKLIILIQCIRFMD
jgi:hypothetical protein